MHKRKLGKDLEVSAIGLGCMGMTYSYGTGLEAKEADSFFQRALDLGINFFDTAEVYGPFTNEVLVGQALKKHRDKVVIATKFGFRFSEAGEQLGVDGRPETVKRVAEESLKRLGTDVIDLYYQHRVDPEVPIEDTVGAMADLVKAGKVRALGLSEANAATLRRAHTVHPISALQSEYSLITRDPEPEILPVCRELGITFVPFSPLARGLLTGAIRSPKDLEQGDQRLGHPRFQAENMQQNLSLVDKIAEIAAEKGVTAAQIALAWVLNQGNDIVPIPGARKLANLEANAAAADIKLSPADLKALSEAVPPEAVAGARYGKAGMAMVNK
ncbi:aldo/keto reductase [Terrihabitans soli]|uniref:Aldo/keto reductase n=1 Tax=Terrihabitans soli TaxID=708113 RepID=A0A6S6QQA1_9HYPH|nr:aldo/keto reductase [Terrihabitans soli]BCJ91219.1 aldo/keto reductase [Terrihabitans soli]